MASILLAHVADCPLCRAPAFVPTGQRFRLADLLARWESEAGVTFHRVVWDEYAQPADRHVRLHHCLNCGFGMFQPPVEGSRQFYADVTAKEYFVTDKWEFLEGLQDLRRYGCRRVLDVGCGSGEFLDQLRAEGFEAVGYEFSPEVAAQAQARGHLVCQGGFPQAVLEATGGWSFDAVCLFQVLEHTGDPAGLLAGVRQLVRPDGLVIVGVPDSTGPIRFFSGALTELPPHHVSRWSEPVFREAMPGLGFYVEKVAREPLPDYLWQAYLPYLWEASIWPAELCRQIPEVRDRLPVDQILWLVDHLKQLGVRWLPGVPGHSLYVILRCGEVAPPPGSDPLQSHITALVTEALARVEQQREDATRAQQVEIMLRITRRERQLAAQAERVHQAEIELGERAQALGRLEAELGERAQALGRLERTLHTHWAVRLEQWLRRLRGKA